MSPNQTQIETFQPINGSDLDELQRQMIAN